MENRKRRIGIVGAGHAGVEAARTAAKDGTSVVVFSDEPTLPYFRPRLVALAFGQVAEPEIAMHPGDWYGANSIDLRVNSPVRALVPASRTLQFPSGEESFDAVILATGAGPAIPPFIRQAPERVLPLWKLEHARRIHAVLRPGGSILVIGGGVIGIETALRAQDAGFTVAIVEKLGRLMPAHLGPPAADVLRRILERRGIRVLAGRTIAAVERHGPEDILVRLEPEETLRVSLAIVSVGIRCDVSLASHAGLDTGEAILVNRFLETSAPGVFACGDAARIPGIPARCSVPEALAQGRVAAANAIAHCAGAALAPHAAGLSPLSFRYKDVEIRSAGILAANPDEEIRLDDTEDLVYRVQVVRGGTPVGIHMVGTGRDFEKYTAAVKEASG